MAGFSDEGIQGGSAGMAMSDDIQCKVYIGTTDASGIATVYPTDDGTILGNAIYERINYVHRDFPSGNPNLAAAEPVISPDRKSISVQCYLNTFTATTILGIPVLGTISLGTAPAGITVNLLVNGYLP